MPVEILDVATGGFLANGALTDEERYLRDDLIELLQQTQPSDEECFWQKLFVGMMKLRSTIVNVPKVADCTLPIRRAISMLKSIYGDE